MTVPRPVVVDFETFAVEPRPAYPPVPVGVAIKYPGKEPRYYAFAHTTGNNCCWSEARQATIEAWNWSDGVLFQNAKFDLEVARVAFGLPFLPWHKIHDTLFLIFLNNPHQKELSLKPSAELLLGMKPEERDALADWLVEHQPVKNVKISRSSQSPSYFAKYIAMAPGDLVGKYGIGDVVRTEKLFETLYPSIVNRRMLQAYDRERRLLPVLLEMERTGVPVDERRLRCDVTAYHGFQQNLDSWLLKKLKASDLNLDSGPQLMDAMLEAGYVDVSKVPRTEKTGQLQSNKVALELGVNNKQLLHVLKYRAQLNTCLHTFMEPWLTTARRSGGLIFSSWNQVRQPRGDESMGTRTGRLSSTPNFQNIARTFEPLFQHEQKGLPKAPIALPSLPRVRSYLTPFPGEVLLDRDYSQQELRILAHYDGGSLQQRYNADPWMDVHDYAREELEEKGLFYERKPVKNTNFMLIYGGGAASLAERNGMTVEDAAALKRAVLSLYPGLAAMYQTMKRLAAEHKPIMTWGGREYYCEEPKIINGRIQQYDYKMVNVLIQGSAADCTKEAMIRLAEAKTTSMRILLTVHDELVVSAPRKEMHDGMEIMRRALESVEFSVPMLSEGKFSLTNYAELQDYDIKGTRVK